MSESSPPSPRGKPVTRRTVVLRRDALSDAERAAASSVIAAKADAAIAERSAHVVALYAAKGTEVATAKLDSALRGRGVRVVYPRVVDGQRELAFCAVPVEALVLGTFGLREPAAAVRAEPLDSIDVFVVPGVAFDRSGGRLGWGRGYYDATLASARGARMGLAFECQLVDEVAHEAHDIPMNLIVTEVATRVVAK
ncbi:MAG TPA: 5-formyltetrahydrofolate cyclo-ligase [Kofleriaceae bacterium]